ncbi:MULTISPECIES: CoA ester lyase [unclassified Micromonospora]|uniref:HpcH/HpaI aldolase/citrate lyase family protein n=1 Tax=unclassified Micromonospora TaxID=2617518 RepID=UPI0003EED564|nr:MULTISPECIES: CoA ester lyase [unclassified Micromonospora]EWM63097.1 HpcH/HpaI aldolase/citrate lyase [Micromonospora sp. M42]MCK1805723.1 CoA ester lyase [Micromonospora sp. R42106]MCK1831536.1 CoA ester lyase [Micromonospora sp. R42003]MCK1843012.1 CoA ester lyase [Micromonospora sp. R42004]MCM1014743.1 CoA ester lyase [Micromonospora sp. XM-20-01]
MAAVARSYLYVPGDRADLLDKAAGRGADALVLDLEDAVTPARKAHARETVAGYLGAAVPAGPELWVRINSDQVAADVEVLSPAAAGVWVPKAEPELLAEVDAALARVQRRLGPDAPAFRVVALIETARGVLTAPRVAAAPRVLRLGLGEADLAGELGLQPGPDRAEFAPIRSQVVVASAAAGITPPVGPVETTLRDPERLELTTRALLRQGFRARSAIHPGQIATINEVFTPTEAEVASARAVLAALERAERGGSGVATDADGRLLDRAVVRAAAEVVRRAEASTD